MSKIHNITPINNQTTAENCREQILAFLKKIITKADIFTQEALIDLDINKLENLAEAIFIDDSNWYTSIDGFHDSLDRFIGYKYLAKCITELDIEQYVVAETKLIIKNEALTNGINITINERGCY